MTEEIDVYEARQINKQYSDDTWQLTGYTAELRNNNDNSFFAFVDFSGDIGRIRECQNCLTFEIHNKLGPKIKKKDETIAPDDDQFLSCYSCGNTYPIYETHFESKIQDSLETTDNPFEGNESIFLATETRKELRKKGKKRKGRFSSKEHEDPDIQREIDRHGSDNVRIIQ